MNQVLLKANDPATTPERLRRLASHRDARVRMAVARNPNTPIEALFRLAVRYADDVLSNPVLELLALENPNWFSEAPGEAQDALLSSRKCPPALLEWGEDEGGWYSLLAVASNLATPRTLLERIAAKYANDAGEMAKAHVNLAGEFAGDINEEIMKAVMSVTPNLKMDSVAELIAMGSAPDWLLGALARSESDETRQLVTLPPDTPWRETEATPNPPKIFKNWAGWEEVLRDPNASSQALEALIENGTSKERNAALRHPNLSAAFLSQHRKRSLLRRLDSWSGADIMVALASPELPIGNLLRSLRSNYWFARLALAMNPNLPMAGLKRLADDAHRLVRAVVKKRLEAAGRKA
jgi:hypothetical protein